jgi:hypothetical protein
LRKRAASLFCSILFCLSFFEGYSEKAQAQTKTVLDIVVTSPWLSLLTNFIGGVNVKVTSIQEWNDDGELVRRIRTRNLQSLPPESLIMAFDYRDAKGIGLPSEQYENYRPLYDQLPLDENKIDASLSDPSIIPFIAQRVLTVLADWDPANYPYYQRRLAEFQARLYSTTLAGRQILKDQPVYDLTGHSGFLLQAVGCRLTRPSEAEWAAWSAWREIAQLTDTVSRMAEEKVAVVLDYSTPKAIRSILSSNAAVFLIVRPRFDMDYPAFLNDQYISLWSKITSKPLPTPARRR